MSISNPTHADLIAVEKTVLPDNEPVPAVEFDLRSLAETPIRIRLTDTIPAALSPEDIGFSTKFEHGNWTLLHEGVVVYERTLEPEESVRTAYYVRNVPAEVESALGEDPELTVSLVGDDGHESLETELADRETDRADLVHETVSLDELVSETDGGVDQATREGDGEGDERSDDETTTARDGEEDFQATDEGDRTDQDGPPEDFDVELEETTSELLRSIAELDDDIEPAADEDLATTFGDIFADNDVPVVDVAELIEPPGGDDHPHDATDDEIHAAFENLQSVVEELELETGPGDGDGVSDDGEGTTDGDGISRREGTTDGEDTTDGDGNPHGEGTIVGEGTTDGEAPTDGPAVGPFDSAFDEAEDTFEDIKEVYGPISRGELVEALLEELADADGTDGAARLRERLGTETEPDVAEDLGAIRSRIAELSKAIESVEPFVERELATEAVIDDLESELDVQQGTLDIILESVDAVKTGQAAHASKMADLEAELPSLAGDVPDGEVAALADELETLASRVATDETTLQSVMDDLETVSDDEADLEGAVAGLQEAVTDTATLTAAIEELEDRMADTASLADSVADLESRVAANASLAERVDALESRVSEDEELRRTVERLDAKLAGVDDVADRDELVETAEALEASATRTDDLAETVDDVEAKLARTVETVERLAEGPTPSAIAADVDESLSSMDRRLAAVESESSEITDLEERVSAMEELTPRLDGIETRLAVVETIRDELEVLVGALEGVRDETSSRADVERVERRVDAMSREMETNTAGLRAEGGDLRERVDSIAATQERIAAIFDSIAEGARPVADRSTSDN